MSAAQLQETAPPVTAALALDQKTAADAGPGLIVVAAWLAVWIPLGWGIWVTLQKAVLLFK
jgi:hypothetical protein